MFNKIKLLLSEAKLQYFVASLMLVALITFPQLIYKKFDPSLQIVGDGGDNYQFYSFVYFAKYNIQNLRHPFSHVDLIRYPVGFDFGASSDGSFFILLGVLLAFILPLTLSYNIALFIMLVLNVYLSFLSFTFISKTLNKSVSFLQLLLVSLTFGLSPYVLSKTGGHLNLLFVGGFPVFLGSVINIVKKLLTVKFKDFAYGKVLCTKDYLLIYLGLLLIGMGSLQYYASLVAVTALVVVVFALVFGFRWFLIRFFYYLSVFCLNNIKAFFISLNVFIACTLFLWMNYIERLFGTGNLRLFGTTQRIYDLFIPNAYLGSWWGQLNPSAPSIESVATIGIASYIGLAYVLYKEKNSKGKIIFISIFAGLLLLTSSHIRVPVVAQGARFVVYISLVVSLLFLITSTLRPPVLKILFLMCLLERFLLNIYISPVFPKHFFSIINKQPGELVVNIPVRAMYAQFKNLIPVFTNKKIVDGYMHYVADTPDTRVFMEKYPISTFNCDMPVVTEAMLFSNDARVQLLKDLKYSGVSTLVIFRDVLYTRDCSKVKDLFEKLQLLGNNDQAAIEKVFSGQLVDIYKINDIK